MLNAGNKLTITIDRSTVSAEPGIAIVAYTPHCFRYPRLRWRSIDDLYGGVPGKFLQIMNDKKR